MSKKKVVHWLVWNGLNMAAVDCCSELLLYHKKSIVSGDKRYVTCKRCLAKLRRRPPQ